MPTCPHCGADAGDARFCPVDGTPLAHLGRPPPDRELTTGDVVDGRYRIVAELGRGGIGIVYLAESDQLGDVAIKVLSSMSAERQTTVSRFAREARLASRLDHPNVVRVHEFGFDPAGFYFLVMEVLEGRSLYREIADVGPLAPGRALPLLRQVASGLSMAHALGVVHRDLKSENVMLRPQAGREADHVVLMDFGLSRTDESWGGAMMTTEGQLVGTPTYMAPEQWRGESIGPPTDVYAFGVLAYEVLGGAPPFGGTNVVKLMRAHLHEAPPPLRERPTRGVVPPAIVELVHRCLEKAIEDRPPSMREVHHVLEAQLSTLRSMSDADTVADAASPSTSRPKTRDAIRQAVREVIRRRGEALQRSLEAASHPGAEAITDGVREPEAQIERMGADLERALQDLESAPRVTKDSRDPTLHEAELRAESLRARLDGTVNVLEERYRGLLKELAAAGVELGPVVEATSDIDALRVGMLRASQ